MKKYSRWQRVLIAFRGSCPTEYREIKEGYVMHYVFKCPIHGYVEGYAREANGRLICPKCIENKDEQ